MKIGLLCAIQQELDPFLPYMEQVHITEKASLRFYECTLSGIPTVAVRCGVCRVNAATASQILIDVYGVNAIINAGTAGGMEPSVKLFDVVASTEACYHDLDEELFTQFGSCSLFQADAKLLAAMKSACANDPSVHFGRMITGEIFVQDDMRDSLNLKFAPLSADMETAGMAQVCYMNGIPFLSVRAISDTAEHNGLDNFAAHLETAASCSKDAVLKLLTELRTLA